METLDRLLREVDAEDALLAEVAFDRHVGTAMTRIPREIVPELPDRIIAATALHLNLPVITRDRRIRVSGLESVW